jgi:hypothetical protein
MAGNPQAFKGPGIPADMRFSKSERGLPAIGQHPLDVHFFLIMHDNVFIVQYLVRPAGKGLESLVRKAARTTVTDECAQDAEKIWPTGSLRRIEF